jgi:HEAT repeat protein
MDPRLVPLISDLRGRYSISRKRAVEALVELGALAVPALIETLSHHNTEAQSGAAEALERIGTPEAIEAVAQWRTNKG